jgi:hypothetical protein
MPSNPTEVPGPAWREAPSTPRRRLGPEPAWHRPPAAHAGALARLSYATRLGIASLALLTCLALLVWLSLWFWPPRSTCAVLVGTTYEEDLTVPHGLFGWGNLESLAHLAREDAAAPRAHWRYPQGDPLELRPGDAWDRDLDKIPANTLLFFLALHGGSDSRGAYFLLPNAGADPGPRNRLRLEDVLNRLGRLPPGLKKILVLDPTQLTANWQLGLLHNDFVRGLKDLDGRIAGVPNLVVLCASDVDQRSWACAEWRQTAFGHYVVEGLKGAADVSGEGRISALDLYGYVRENVEQWARTNREALQTPILLPAAEGEERARHIVLTVPRGYVGPDVRDLVRFEPPPALAEAWGKFQQLQALVPSPAVYTPHRWRQYGEGLCRYEQLLRAGAPSAAGRMQARLAELEQAILRDRRLSLRSVQNTLTMPAAAGLAGLDTASLQPAFNELWEANPTDAAVQWFNLAKLTAEDPVRRTWLRAQFYDFLLLRAAADPRNHLDRVARLCRLPDDLLRPRPAEIHFLLMLQREMARRQPNAAWVDVAAQALRVRRLAERAALAVRPGLHPYSEQVFPWLAPQIQDADRERQFGQDLLFATDRAAWADAAAHLGNAEQTYLAAEARGDAVRRALAVRDRVLTFLPAYSEWLARRRPSENPERYDRTEALLRQAEDLWQHTHRLLALLEKPTAGPLASAAEGGPGLAPLVRQTERVAGGYDALEQQFLQFCGSLTDVELPSVWRDIEDVLAVPALAVDRRLALLRTASRTSYRLLLETAQNLSAARPVTAAENQTQVRATARRQGRMAVAVLGRAWFDRDAGLEQENYEQVIHRLETFAVESRWWQSLDIAGDQVGRRWREVPVEIGRLVAEALPENAEEALPQLRGADRLNRLLDGATRVPTPRSPSQVYRWLSTEELLLWQARRTFEDHWFGEDPAAEPYYRLSGQLFTADAGSLQVLEQPLPGLASIQQKLDGPGQLVFGGPGRVQVTSEQEFWLDYRLRPERNAVIPSGYPVVWLETGTNLRLLTRSDAEREPRKLGAETRPEPLRCRLASPLIPGAESNPPRLPQVVPTTATVRGFYRGQPATLTTRIDLHPLPEVAVLRRPVPQRADLALRADRDVQERYGEGNGAVVIVLDCSGSMGPVVGERFNETTRYNQATRALRKVLQKLPRGTRLSLWTFGEAMGQEKTVAAAERTIRQVRKPAPWNPDDPAELQALMGKLDYPALVPWNESPIVRTILMAREDLRTATGFKTILAITDGMDNRFEHDREFNPQGKSVPAALLDAFRDSDIQVNVIGFRVHTPEEAKAREHFEVVEQFPVPGHYYLVKQEPELAVTLEKALRQRLRYWIDDADNVPVAAVPPGGLDVSRSGANDQWIPGGLAPGGYRLRVYAPGRLEKYVELDPGDLLLVRLAFRRPDGEGGLAFERVLFTKADYPWKPAQEQAGWRFAVLQNQLTEAGGLQMLYTLEKLYDRRESMLQQIKPRAAWFELGPVPGQPFAVRWANQPGYPAPAWALDVPEWPTLAGPPPGPARPVPRVWWNPDQDTPRAVTLDRGRDFGALSELTGRPLQIEGDAVTLEDVRVEEHVVETQPGVRTPQSCLVVRLVYAPDRPIWAEVRGVNAVGEEHRFYQSANRYTGLFWPVTAAAAEKALTRVGLISLAAFKRTAEQRGFALEMKDLPAPSGNDGRPGAPIELK